MFVLLQATTQIIPLACGLVMLLVKASPTFAASWSPLNARATIGFAQDLEGTRESGRSVYYLPISLRSTDSSWFSLQMSLGECLSEQGP